jgi:hypothetical protein
MNWKFSLILRFFCNQVLVIFVLFCSSCGDKKITLQEESYNGFEKVQKDLETVVIEEDITYIFDSRDEMREKVVEFISVKLGYSVSVIFENAIFNNLSFPLKVTFFKGTLGKSLSGFAKEIKCHYYLQEYGICFSKKEKN